MLLRPIPEIRSECRLYAASSLKEGPRQQPNHIFIQRTPSLQMNNLNGGLMGPKHTLHIGPASGHSLKFENHVRIKRKSRP